MEEKSYKVSEERTGWWRIHIGAMLLATLQLPVDDHKNKGLQATIQSRVGKERRDSVKVAVDSPQNLLLWFSGTQKLLASVMFQRFRLASTFPKKKVLFRDIQVNICGY
jgi:hypothetical protein